MAGDKATISRESFYKSLGKLEALAGVQQQTQQPQLNPEAIVEKMQKGEQLTAEEMDLVKSQICTGPNSERTSWPGGQTSDVPGNGPGADKIKPNGTDYNERGMRKSIAEKVAKGLPLTADELALLKSDLEKGDEVGGSVEKAKDDKDKEEFGRDIGKSFNEVVNENDTLQKGIEVSEFLSEFAKSFGSGIEASENRTMGFVQDIGQQLFTALHEFKAEQADFNKSLAESIVNIGHGVAGSMEQVQQVAEMPAGPPRSQQLRAIPGGQERQGFVQKSLGGPGEGISKSMMTEVMTDMLEKGEGGIQPVEIIKFDSTGEIRPELQAKIVARIQGAGQ